MRGPVVLGLAALHPQNQPCGKEGSRVAVWKLVTCPWRSRNTGGFLWRAILFACTSARVAALANRIVVVLVIVVVIVVLVIVVSAPSPLPSVSIIVVVVAIASLAGRHRHRRRHRRRRAPRQWSPSAPSSSAIDFIVISTCRHHRCRRSRFSSSSAPPPSPPKDRAS